MDVSRAAFSRYATLVAVATSTGAIHIIERDTKRRLQRIDVSEPIHALRFGADSKFLEVMTGVSDLQRRRYFLLPTDRLLEEACRRTTRKNLTAEEWETLVGRVPASSPCAGADGITIPAAAE